jgi:hypothetical protein
MPAKPSRFWVVVTLVLLLAAQAHLWLDEGSAPSSGHVCKFCSYAAWAILSVDHGLQLTLRTERLEVRALRRPTPNLRTGENAPRAPPKA